eukprot:SAG31_NODE_4213_length_3461_cov_1.715645_3_plen_108_part_00
MVPMTVILKQIQMNLRCENDRTGHARRHQVHTQLNSCVILSQAKSRFDAIEEAQRRMEAKLQNVDKKLDLLLQKQGVKDSDTVLARELTRRVLAKPGTRPTGSDPPA